jgi:competence protein ComEC
MAILTPRRWPKAWAPAVISAMVLAGAASYDLHRARLPGWDERPPREVHLSVRVDRVFTPKDLRRVSGLATVVRAAAPVAQLNGQNIYYSIYLRSGEAPPIRSAILSLQGVLTGVARDPPADTFEGYLAAAGINFRLNRGRVLAVERPAHAYYRFCTGAAQRCHEILGLGIATKRPALAGLLRAMMLGDTHELSDEQHTLFMQSGTMHLFAISGLNIGVIAGALQALLLLLRLPAGLRFAVGAALLWLFVDVTGAAPSAVRAFAMAVFLQAAMVLHRPANLVAALVASAFAVLLVSPLQVFSASFLMSYAIVAALLVLGLPLGEAWVNRWGPWRDLPRPAWRWWQQAMDWLWRSLAAALAVGLATTLVSLLTGLQYFRLLTPGALLANLILIPTAMAVTLGGFASVLCGLIHLGPGAVLCNHAAALVLLVIEWLVRLSVRVPGAFVPAHFSRDGLGMISLLLLIATLIAGYAWAWRRQRGWWWPPFVLVALVLAFGVQFD